MADTVTLSKREVKRELKRRGITQDRLAAYTGVGRTYVNHWWNGRRHGARITAAARRMLETADRKD